MTDFEEFRRNEDELRGSRFFPGHEQRMLFHQIRVEFFERLHALQESKHDAELSSRVLELRASGLTCREIADLVGFSEDKVSKICRMDLVRKQDRERKRRKRKGEAA